MFKVKDTEKKVSAPKRTITIEDCYINEDGFICDEEGVVSPAIADALPEGVNLFTIKISLELPDEEDDKNEENDEE